MTVGRLASQERYKGFDEVIEIMPELLKRFPTLKYLIVGDGPDRPRLEAKAGALGLSNKIIFTGYIPESEKVAHYNLADAYVMPSMGEGFGIVLIEAAACGVPVVGSRVDGSREALLDGRLGRLVDPKSPSELLQAVAIILEVSPVANGSMQSIYSANKISTLAWLIGAAGKFVVLRDVVGVHKLLYLTPSMSAARDAASHDTAALQHGGTSSASAWRSALTGAGVSVWRAEIV